MFQEIILFLDEDKMSSFQRSLQVLKTEERMKSPKTSQEDSLGQCLTVPKRKYWSEGLSIRKDQWKLFAIA